MKKSALTCLALGWILASACGGANKSKEHASTKKPLAAVPDRHRPQPVDCSQSTAPGSGACQVDTDCHCAFTLAPPRCVSDPAGNNFCTCDQCLTDSDCSGNQVCSCQGQTFAWAHQSWGNSCISANCQIDDDCGAENYCSPTVSSSCGSFYGTQGYYCHTTADQCTNDSDCPQPGYCAFAPQTGAWVCGNSFCAG